MNLTTPIYFDNAASTPPFPEVVERLNELNLSVFGNSSSTHKAGQIAQEVLFESCAALGELFKVPPNHVVFTSGGTESNNLAIWGSLGGLTQTVQWLKSGGSGKLITSCIEHAATSKVFESLEELGAPVVWAQVNQEGLLDLHHLEDRLTARTRLVSIHHIQNEIGAVQDLSAISRLVRKTQPDAIIHTDAIQSFMKVPVSFEELGVDLISISGHKIGGPKGIGALILGRRFETRTPKLGAFIQGSSQQSGVRPGTVPVPLIGALVAAVVKNQKNYSTNREKLLSLQQYLISKLPGRAVLNGPPVHTPEEKPNPRRAPQTINFSVPGLPAAVTVEALSARGFCVSSGSACHSANPKPNETLTKMGVSRDRALSAVRVSFSPQNTAEEIDFFINHLEDVIRQYL